MVDFGLSRNTNNNYYVSENKGNIAIKWAAIESVEFAKFSSQSDVWSFGVLMWELFTLGRVPFASMTNQEAFEAITKGKRLEKPDLCPNPKIWEMVTKCWNTSPSARPTFGELEEFLIQANNGKYDAAKKPLITNPPPPKPSFYVLEESV